MPQLTFDLLDGLPPLSIVVDKSAASRLATFMAECTEAVDEAKRLRSACEAKDQQLVELRASIETAQLKAIAFAHGWMLAQVDSGEDVLAIRGREVCAAWEALRGTGSGGPSAPPCQRTDELTP
ncbi:hypothetical protein [Dolichospermum phage Dfl-JY45]